MVGQELPVVDHAYVGVPLSRLVVRSYLMDMVWAVLLPVQLVVMPRPSRQPGLVVLSMYVAWCFTIAGCQCIVREWVCRFVCLG